MKTNDIQIAPAKDGYQPSVGVINKLRRRARSLGLFSDWPVIAVLANHDLLLDCSPLTGNDGADLLAVKRHGKWMLGLDSDLLLDSKREMHP